MAVPQLGEDQATRTRTRSEKASPRRADRSVRRGAQVVEGHRDFAAPSPLESIHVNPHAPYRTPCYRRILREAQGVTLIKCDALSSAVKAPERRNFYQLAWSHGPLYPPDDGKPWVEPIVLPVIEVSDPQEYDVSTSDEEEPLNGVTDSEEDDDSDDAFL